MLVFFISVILFQVSFRWYAFTLPSFELEYWGGGGGGGRGMDDLAKCIR